MLMLQVASEERTGIKVLYLPSSELCSQSNTLESRWNDSLPINGIQKMHMFEPDPKATDLSPNIIV
jgi:hypothetical protein